MANENTKVCMEQGGDTLTVKSGGAIDIQAGGKVLAAGAQAAAITAITDSTGGSATSTLAAITAGAGYAQADMVAAKDGLATLAAKLNSLMTACKNAGITA